VRGVGSLGLLCRGYANGHVSLRATGEGEPGLISGSELTGTFGLNTNGAKTVDLTARWNEAHAENTIVMESFTVDLVN
jgi:hypothetical protein